ncbi:Cu-Zn family superoxide dismutase [Scopulibacillus daqui]|uniref:Cu-Zn family superoxide dismutase n=1 Tax=Scopulibacillus daqui TaxID=1469162 RepID=A0ABS2PW28_9BACL|nr:superoxide dismutase family protein [Scopulibacillus daqui]MBM7643915.1 Cu-Zn family superoxide dismutase [Scopulibacillus daqui]
MKNGLYVFCGIVIAVFVFIRYDFPFLAQASEHKQTSPKLVIPLKNSNGQQAGQAVLTENEKGVNVHINAFGLKPGIHAVHFHEKGVCEPPGFTSSGSRFNPFNKEHGLEKPNGPHAGDMRNIFADTSGTVKTTIVNPRVTLKKGEKNSLRDADGSALIIDENGDDLKSNPVGKSGNRVMCGVIK